MSTAETVKPTRRIKKNLDELVGKTISRMGWGGQIFWLLFTDGTYVFMSGSNWVISYDYEIHGSWRVDLGLMSEEDARKEKEEQQRRYAKYREGEDRKILAELLEKYPDAAGSTAVASVK